MPVVFDCGCIKQCLYQPHLMPLKLFESLIGVMHSRKTFVSYSVSVVDCCRLMWLNDNITKVILFHCRYRVRICSHVSTHSSTMTCDASDCSRTDRDDEDSQSDADRHVSKPMWCPCSFEGIRDAEAARVVVAACAWKNWHPVYRAV